MAKLRSGKLPIALLSLAVTSLPTAGCGLIPDIATSTTATTSGITGPSFVIGTDAPMSAVTSFSVVVESVNAITSTGTSVPLLSGTPTVDFARYNGLQSLMDMNDVPAGIYTSVQVTFGAATISYPSVGTFQMQVTGLGGLLVPQTVTVCVSPITTFRNEFSTLGGVTGSVRVVGLLVKDPTTGGTDLIARYVDVLN